MNNNFPKISIITPSYNQGQFIEETILSIINQGYPNLEYIIIDGGSTDNTVEIIKKYEKHISYWISEPDKGQSDAINKGIAVATGDVFNWVNSDDLLCSGSLQLVGTYFQNPELQVLCTPTQLLHPDGTKTINSYTHYDKPIYDLLNSTGLNQQGMFWRMNCIKTLNGVNPNFHYSMDLDLWKRFLLSYGTNHILKDETITGVFRLHHESKTGGDFSINFYKFELENNAALIQYASIVGNQYVKATKRLYPEYKKELANLKAHSLPNIETIKTWLNKLFYQKGQKAFYENNFSLSYKLLKNIDNSYLTAEELKNKKSYVRWSFLKRLM